MRAVPIVTLVALTFLAAFAACGNDVSSTGDAQKAYLGLDTSVDKAIQLGFDGYNLDPTGANIQPQTANGGVAGTMTVTGQTRSTRPMSRT